MYTRAMIVAGIASLLFGVALCDLNVVKTKDCGQLECQYAEFCSIIDNTCKHCSKICDEGHNQEIRMCNDMCQDYIHDMRFVKKGETFGVYNNLDQLRKLQLFSTVSLIISLIVLACILFLVITLWLNKKTKFNIFKLISQRRRKEEKSMISRKDDVCQIGNTDISTICIQNDKLPSGHELNEVIHTNPRIPQMDYSTLTTTFKNYHAKSEPDSVSSQCTNKSNKTCQPLAVRLPSEDSTMDFMYDNPALAPSPTLEKENSQKTQQEANGNRKRLSENDT